MTAAELIKLLSTLPLDAKVEIFASTLDEELAIDLIERYDMENGQTWVMLMDRGCEQGAGSKLLLDRRTKYEGY